VVVRFDAAGQAEQQPIYVAGAVADYHQDQAVQVVYDASNPARVQLVGVVVSNRGLPAVIPFLGGLLLAAMALVAGRHTLFVWRVVRNSPWRSVDARLVQVPQSVGMRQGSRSVLVLDTPDGPLPVEPVGLSRVDPSFEPQTWLAGFGTRTMVVGAPGGRHVVAVRPRRKGRREAKP
jgi:hypothetical protein